MASIKIAPEIEIDLWLSKGIIELFVGEDSNQPTESVPLSDLVRQEVIACCLPASAQRLDEIRSIPDLDEVIELRDAFLAITETLTALIVKHDDDPEEYIDTDQPPSEWEEPDRWTHRISLWFDDEERWIYVLPHENVDDVVQVLSRAGNILDVVEWQPDKSKLSLVDLISRSMYPPKGQL